ncbi:MAG: acyl--CoA ligase [Campylobacterales bacterium]
MSLANLFLNQANALPTKVAVICEDRALTYAELAKQVRNCVVNLQKASITQGSHITLILPNSVEFAVFLLAFAYLGVVAIPFSPSMPIETVLKGMRRVDSSIMIASSDYFVRNDCQAIDNVLFYEAKNFLTEVEGSLFLSDVQRSLPFIITMTSGSTGEPKPIILTQETKIRRAMEGAKEIYGLSGDDVIIAATPMYHSLAQRLVLLPLMMGATSVIMRHFTPKRWLEAVERHRVTFTLAVSSQLEMLLREELESYDLSSLRCIVSSSAPLALETKKALVQQLKCQFHECYGASEIGIATNLAPEDGVAKLGSVGKPLPHVTLRLSPEGEIEVKTTTLFSGYYRQEEKTKEAMDGEFFKTGDLGWIDEEGFLYYSGRKKDLIITGGINVYPKDIEEVLAQVEGVCEVAVIGVADPYFGEAIVAVVVANEGVSKQQLQRACRRHLADYQQPHAYEFVESLPKNEMGKIQKERLREKFLGYDATKELRKILEKRG